MLAHAVRHQKLRLLRPAVIPFGEPNLLLAERMAVGGTRIVLVRRAVADVAIDDDQRRTVVRRLERREGPRRASPGRWRRRLA